MCMHSFCPTPDWVVPNCSMRAGIDFQDALGMSLPVLWRYVDVVLDSAWFLDPVLGPPKIALVDYLST